ncbi:hypothetical protein ACHAWU_002603 [Discostella pseudostelligera]|uniref:Pseudouridine synthase I TruA alpha/beta domain-containing protein n=1 Tax=Discostella pseudostelligera TaxID=259834 RepID=A0ABD3MPW6_9STRA
MNSLSTLGLPILRIHFSRPSLTLSRRRCFLTINSTSTSGHRRRSHSHSSSSSSSIDPTHLFSVRPVLLVESSMPLSTMADANNSSVADTGGSGEGAPTAQSSNNNTNTNSNTNNNTTGVVSSKKRKADRWKQLNQEKKDNRRVSAEKNNRRKHEYDEVSQLSPHEGSFAHEKMRQLFNVSIVNDEDDGDGKKQSLIHSSNENRNVDAAATATTTIAAMGADEDPIARVPKRKLAILVSFLGTDYFGFQINPNHRTLQAELELALYKARIISKYNFGFPNKYSWSNSARTDKGVHAAAQVCSFKGEMVFHSSTATNDNDDGKTYAEGGTGGGDHDYDDDDAVATQKLKSELDAMRNKVNEYLPSEIRVLDIARPTRMFCARTNRNKVRYQYMVPSYMFCPREEVRDAFAMEGGSGGVVVSDSSNNNNNNNNLVQDETTTFPPEILAQARNRLMKYRVSPDQLERLQRGLKLFEGTHCFHNYTRRVGANDASSNRYILSFVPLDPILVPSEGSDPATITQEGMLGDTTTNTATQWIPLQVVGQSFLLNQIRKMVSAAVDLARGAVSEETILQSLTKQCRMKVNVAPAQGLFLDRSYYEFYNRNKAKNAPKAKNKSTNADAQQHQQHDITLDWAEAGGQEEFPPAVARIEEFKNEKIIPHIVQEEMNEGNFLRYIHMHDRLFHEMYCPMDGNDDNQRIRDQASPI